VCVMMTAMDVGHLPLALVRSGRVELWLEMKLPGADARRTILERQLAKTGRVIAVDDYEAVLAATEGFTGADLKRVVEDAKGLLAFDRVSGEEPADSRQYLARAIEGVTLNKKRYAEAEKGAREKVRPVHPLFQMLSQMPGGGPVAFNMDWSGGE
jgi:transitional endoplasmic reticulum ATPase